MSSGRRVALRLDACGAPLDGARVAEQTNNQDGADLPPLRGEKEENEKFGAERQVYWVLRQAKMLGGEPGEGCLRPALKVQRAPALSSRIGELSPERIYTSRYYWPQKGKRV